MKEIADVLFQSEIMGNLLKMMTRVAPSKANILILGESGTGKEVIAYKLHNLSTRKSKPFVSINCAALNETLLESELFGHEKGAFPGAVNRKIGLVEVASGGTLFLKEIGKLPEESQAKILRLIQENEFYRMGGTTPISADVRLICSTNQELDQEVSRGNFREDLFYRINTIIVSAPSLRRHKEDIPLLVNLFLKSTGKTRGVSISEDAMKALMKYDWSGNVQELKNVCERMQLLSEGSLIKLSEVPEEIKNPKSAFEDLKYDANTSLFDLEKQYILKALAFHDGNKTAAANSLGITIKTLYNKLHEYGEFDKFKNDLKIVK